MANIMIVDDSAMILNRMRAILEGMGHRIAAEAGDGREAVALYDPNRIDLVTMDIQMPRMDGIEAVRQIRRLHPEAAIVMVSSVEERAKIFDAIKMGARHYILKPFTEEKVREVLNAVLGPSEASGNRRPDDEAGATTSLESAAASAPVQREAAARQKQERSGASLKLTPTLFSALPFELSRKEDRTVLVIQRHIRPSNLKTLHTCLQGLLYQRKLKCVVECWEPVVQEAGFQMLVSFVEAVREQGGTIGIVTDNDMFFTQLRMKLDRGIYRSYKEIQW
ncbi:response regulator [Cohnella fermenti]|uniref:Response regulator n=1 Tax=Cohnella fermenti TaxID=2565925 RepID=A0A4S4BQD3_9BACL|nr:response regulator [Cohnella fermenti]THF77148.1 response regulator [Cohnella fermenti]